MKLLLITILAHYTLQTEARAWTFNEVLKTAAAKSLKAQIIDTKNNSAELEYAKILESLDWTLVSGYSLKQSSLDTPLKNVFKKPYWNRQVSLQKKWKSGSTLKTSYSQSKNLFSSLSVPPFLSCADFSSPSPQSHCMSFQISQDLMQNFFGSSTRLSLKSGKLRYNNAQLLQKENLKKVLLQAGEKYWNRYRAVILLKYIEKKLKDYKSLVQIAKRKKRLGHSQPGEIPQILAQYERSIKEQMSAKTQLKNSTLDLQTFLQTKDPDFRFKEYKPQPLPKNTNPVQIESLTAFQMAENHYLAQTAELKIRKNSLLPRLQWIGQADFLLKDSLSFKQNFSKPIYTVGLQLSYPIPSSFAGWRRWKNLKLSQMGAELEYVEKKQQLSLQLESNWNTLKSAHSEMRSAEKISKLQKQALKEIIKAYTQGRMTVQALITAQDQTLQVELEKVQAQRRCSLALLQYHALRDQLLSQYTP